MGALTSLLTGALILVYMASMWEADRKRLIWHAAVAAGLLAYVLISSGFELSGDRLFFAGLAGAWLFGVMCHWLGLWAREKRWPIGSWRMPEIAGGVIVSIPLVLGLLGLLAA
ncbi:MAG: hypothetical protein AAF557_02315 [Pseudomonadota bacterium]